MDPQKLHRLVRFLPEDDFGKVVQSTVICLTRLGKRMNIVKKSLTLLETPEAFKPSFMKINISIF